MLWERMWSFVKVGPKTVAVYGCHHKGAPDETGRSRRKDRTQRIVKKWTQSPDDVYYFNHLETGFSVTCSLKSTE